MSASKSKKASPVLVFVIISLVVAVLAIVAVSFAHSNDENKSDKTTTTAFTRNSTQIALDKVEFEKVWKELNVVDRRNLRPTIRRIPTFHCKLQLIDAYLNDADGLYNIDHDSINFQSQCPVAEDESVSEETPDEKVNNGGGSSESQPVERSTKQPHFANDHKIKKKKQAEPLDELFYKRRDEYLANTDKVLAEMPKEFLEIKLAYMLLLHNNLEHVKRLIKRIYVPHFYYVIHVDAKTPKSYLNEVQSVINSLIPKNGKNNVVLYSKHSVTWGGPSMVLTMLDMMAILFDRFDHDWDYCIDLSGADYPLRSNADIVQELAVNAYLLDKKDVNYLSLYLNDLQDNKSIKLGFTECDNYLYLAGWRPLPRGIEIWTGSQWFILHRKFVKYLVYDNTFVPQFIDYIKNQLIPDELFFQTVFKASPFCNDAVTHNLREIKWRETSECFYDRIADSCGRHPDSYVKGDLELLKREPTSLFARKFSTGDMTLLDELDHWSDNRKNPKNLEGVYRFFVNSDQCLTAIDEGKVLPLPCNHLTAASGASIPEQEWTIAQVTDVNDVEYDSNTLCLTQSRNTTTFSIVNVKYGTCLDYEGPDEPSSLLILWPCHFRDKQRWKFIDRTNTEEQEQQQQEEEKFCSLIANLSSYEDLLPDLCADMSEDLDEICLWPCNASPNQHMKMEKVVQ